MKDSIRADARVKEDDTFGLPLNPRKQCHPPAVRPDLRPDFRRERTKERDDT